MQRRSLIWLLLIFMFIIETTVFHWIIPAGWQEYLNISPHFVLTCILFVALYSHRHLALILGLAFGLLQDVTYYGHMIGPFSFGMGLTGYLTGLMFRRGSVSFLFAMFVMAFSLFYFELIIYGIYRLFNIADEPLDWVLMFQVLPSLLFNLLFALLIYIPVRYLIERMDYRREGEES
jgi:rod shape-determining protein MreD